ncbi:MAG TPA: FAD-dependent oxidoreductase [Caulobacteraceae bacterium]|nr:FAD-dependent oxidoreductase [Caulobacteraceae bacterium]
MRGVSIVVAGAGALGSAIACRLARAGGRVLVADSAPAGANASGVAAGMLAPAFETLFDAGSGPQFDLLREARDRWPAIARDLGLAIDRSGAVAAGSPEDVDAWEQSLARIGADARRLSAAEVARLSPALRPGLAGLRSMDEWRLSSLQTLDAMRRAATAAGARFRGAEIRDFRPGRLEITAAGRASADWLVVATGAGRALQALAPELAAIAPIKGHILRAETRLPAGPTLRSREAYLCPTGAELILGATMEPGVEGAAIDAGAVARLEASGARLCPSLAGVNWRPAVGVRASTPDGLPLAGASATPRVILAVGARRNGWLLAPLVAEIVADLIAGRAGTSHAARAFDPARVTAPG